MALLTVAARVTIERWLPAAIDQPPSTGARDHVHYNHLYTILILYFSPHPLLQYCDHSSSTSTSGDCFDRQAFHWSTHPKVDNGTSIRCFFSICDGSSHATSLSCASLCYSCGPFTFCGVPSSPSILSADHAFTYKGRSQHQADNNTYFYYCKRQWWRRSTSTELESFHRLLHICFGLSRSKTLCTLSIQLFEQYLTWNAMGWTQPNVATSHRQPDDTITRGNPDVTTTSFQKTTTRVLETCKRHSLPPTTRRHDPKQAFHHIG